MADGGKYKIIYADPPWEQKAGPSSLHDKNQPTRDLEYPTMTVGQIAALPISEIVEKNACLFLWTTNKYIRQTYDIARAWGFKPSTMLVWCKQPKGRGLGGSFGISTEFLLFARKGSLRHKQRTVTTWFESKRGAHSQKPQFFRELVERTFDGPYLELFARSKAQGWDVWGNEVASDVII